MSRNLRRAGLALVGVLLVVGAAFLPFARGQRVIRRGMGRPVIIMDKAVPPAPAADNGPRDGFENSGLSLPKDEKGLREKIKAAVDYIDDKNWAIAIPHLQKLVDMPEDVFVKIPGKTPDGKDSVKHVSAKSEAYRLIGSLPKGGLEFYKLTYGGKAQEMLRQAKAQGDRALLGEVIRRFAFTDAGTEAILLAAQRDLDRGEFVASALRFNKLLAREEPDKLAPDVLAKMGIVYHLTHDKVNEKLVWQALRDRGREVNLGKETHSIAELQEYGERVAQALSSGNASDSPVYRSTPARANQLVGGPAFLEKRWSLPMIHGESDRRVDPSGSDPECGGDAETDKRIKQAVSWLTQHHQPVLPAFFPITATVVKGDTRQPLVIYRDYWGVQAHNLKDGRLRWWTPASWSLQRMLGGSDHRKSLALSNWLSYYLDQQQRPQIVFENSLAGTLSTDNTFVYVIDDLAVPPPQQFTMVDPRFGGGMNWGEEVAGAIRHNRLQAFSLARSGALSWEAGGEGDKGDLADCFFLGPPLPLGGKLYVLTERQQELRLVCLDPAAGGKVVAAQTLATTNERLEHDVIRRTHAVHLAYGEGILVVPTNAGAVFGIDLLENRLVWAYPYRDKDDAPANRGVNLGPGFPGGLPPGVVWGPDGRPILPIPNTGAWKEAAPTIAEGKVVFTAPDARSLHCVNLVDGASVWTYRRQEDDLYFAGVYRGKVLVVGKKQCRALDLGTGRLTWIVDTGMPPSGQGIASDNLYYLPLHDATHGKERSEICAIDIDRGAVHAHTASRKKEDVPGNLLFFDGDVVSVSATQVIVYPQLKVKIAQMDDLLAKNPNDPEGLTERGTLRLDQGDSLGAIDDLRKALHYNPGASTRGRAREKLYDALTEYVQHRFDTAEEYLSEYEALCKPDLEGVTDEADRARRIEAARKRRSNFLFLVAKGRERQGRLVEAFERYQDFAATAGGDELITVLDEQAVRANADVWARGRIAAMVGSAATAEQRKPLEALIAARWEKARASGRLDELRRFVRMFGSLSAVGKEARFHLAERLIAEGKGSDLLEAERELAAFRTPSEEPAVAARAVEALARLYTRRGLREDAAYCYRLLGHEYARVKVRDGRTGGDFFNDAATDKRLLPYLDDAPLAPVGRMKATEETGSLMAHQSYTFAHLGEPLPYFRRHAFVLRFDNDHLKVLDNRTSPPTEVWSQQLVKTMFQNTVTANGQNTARFPYRSLGHLVVLPVGHMVYGLDPVNQKVLWERNLAGGARIDPHQQVPSQLQTTQLVVDPLDGSLQAVFQDGWKQRLGQAGPLQGSVICLQTRDGLEAVDPLSGQTLWKRSDIASHADLFADESYVYVVEFNGDGTPALGRVFRAADGVTVQDAPNFAAAYEKRAHPAARTLLVADKTPAGGVTLRLYDILTGKDVWSQAFPAKTVVLHSEDPALAGVVEPDGTAHVFDLPSRKEVLRTEKGFDFLNRKTGLDPASLANVQQVHLLADPGMIYLACDGPPDPALARFGGVVTNLLPGTGLRALPVNGRVYAYDRGRGEFRYYVSAPSQMLVLERFAELPVLLFTARTQTIPGGPGFRGGVQFENKVSFLAADKRTGKTLLHIPERNFQQFHALVVDERARVIEMVAADLKVVIHLDADAGKTAAAAPAADPSGERASTASVPPPARAP
jgi:outer membrane protein assembly factor BamB/tetratricopeptide (TPR) repeat protein